MTSERNERRLAAIMFTDIVGYTALHAASEEEGLRVRERQAEILRPLVEGHGGEWIQHVGDETLSSFHSAVDAVSCALAIQQALRDEPHLGVRIGIHVGDVVARAGSLHGDGVNIAARIRPLAEPGGICVSGEVQQAIRSQTNVEAVPLGAQDLKNVGRPVAVFVIGRPGTLSGVKQRLRRRALARRAAPWAAALAVLAVTATWWMLRGPVAGAGPIRSIAVLPLENLSGDPEQEYVADGMTEELIGELARLGALRVISRTSVMRYKQTDKSIPEIASELGVQGVLEGTVTREQGHIRVMVKLIDARTDTHLWSDRFDRELPSVLALRSDVAQAIAEQLRLELTPEERSSLKAARTVDPTAFDAYLRGLEARGSGGGLFHVWAPRAIEEFERAVALDPDFAEAHAALAVMREWLANDPFDTRYRAEFPRARVAAEKALELDDRLGAAHAVLADIFLREWDFEASGRAYEQALRASPSDPTVLNHYAWYLLQLQRIEEALDVMERLLHVAPLDSFYRGVRTRNFSWARQYERALEEYERIRSSDPDFADLDEMVTYFKLGRFEEAHRAHVLFYERCGPPCEWMREAIERGWGEGGWNAAMRRLAEAAGEREAYSPVYVALWYAMGGETEQAFAWLERSYRERDTDLVYLKSPTVDPLRSDPRYDDLLRRIGFPESQRLE